MLTRHKRALVNLFARVHELQADPIEKRMLALEIQEELLRRIIQAERQIKRRKKFNKAIKFRLAQKGNSREAALSLKDDYLKGEDTLEAQRKLIEVLRSIGDSIAFIYGGKWDLKQMVLNKPNPGFISGKRGTRLERAILRRAFAWGATVVMNDLTNTLRHGDITVFRPDLWPEGNSNFMIIEVKSGKGGNKKRSERQMEAMSKLSSYLTDDTKVEDGRVWKRIALQEDSKHHFAIITELAQSLTERSWRAEKIEEGLFYILMNTSIETGNFSEIFSVFPKGGRPSLLISVNEFKKVHFGYLPFPLCFRDPEIIFKFYDGGFVINIAIDIDHINKVLNRRGISVELTSDDHYPLRVFSENPSAESFVGYHPLGRLAGEFLSLEWFINNIINGPSFDEMRELLSDG